MTVCYDERLSALLGSVLMMVDHAPFSMRAEAAVMGLVKLTPAPPPEDILNGNRE